MIFLIAFRDYQSSLEIDKKEQFNVEKYLRFEQDTGKKKEEIHKLTVSNSIGHGLNLISEADMCKLRPMTTEEKVQKQKHTEGLH